MADAFTPNRPLTSEELTRIAAALNAYSAPHTGLVYVVMATAYPHDVLAVTSTRKEADLLVKKRAGYEVYGPFEAVSTPSYSDSIYLTAHDGGCQNLSLSPTVTGLQGPPLATDVVTITLDIAWKPDGPTSPNDRQASNHFVYDLPRTIDTIFLTRNSREAFMYPRYQIVFGARKVSGMRDQLRESPEQF